MDVASTQLLACHFVIKVFWAVAYFIFNDRETSFFKHSCTTSAWNKLGVHYAECRVQQYIMHKVLGSRVYYAQTAAFRNELHTGCRVQEYVMHRV